MLPGTTGPMASTRYRPVARNFDGTNDYLRRVGGLTGAADSKLGTGSVWVRKHGSDGVLECVLMSSNSLAGAGNRCRIAKGPGNDILFRAQNSGGTAIIQIGSSANAVLAGGGWVHFIFSFNLASGTQKHVYVNGASDYNELIYTNDTIDYTLADWSVGADPDATDKLNGDVADLMFWPGVYIDLSVTANLRKFITAARKPVAPQIAIAALGVPLIGLYGPASAWHTNLGSGGGFTLNGALTEPATNPAN